MKNTLLYIATVLIWGSTWLAIEYQLGEVPIVVSVFYRFAIAALIMWGYCLIAKTPLYFSMRNHFFILVLAFFNFGMNYVVIYYSQKYLTSAMTSIAFSTMLLMNIVNTRLFFGIKIKVRVYVGALLGILGIAALFWEDLSATKIGNESLFGLGLVILAAFIASPFSNDEFVFSYQPAYIWSLLYLAVFGTVIAFATYYVLLNNIGPEKASYVIVLFPVVAVGLSSAFEGFTWTQSTLLGFTLVLLGNAIVLTPVEKIVARKNQKKHLMP